ncbi:MAG: HIT domain-containing protein [Planctomycetota bacterium]
MSDKTTGCFLCEAVKATDDKAALIVCRRDSCLCVLNRFPYNNGHLLIAPCAHKAGLEDLTEEDMTGLMLLTRDAQLALQKEMKPQGFNIGANVGEAAGAGLPGHFHIHIVPRWSGDTNFMSALSGTKVIPQSLEDVWNQLRKQFA